MSQRSGLNDMRWLPSKEPARVAGRTQRKHAPTNPASPATGRVAAQFVHVDVDLEADGSHAGLPWYCEWSMPLAAHRLRAVACYWLFACVPGCLIAQRAQKQRQQTELLALRIPKQRARPWQGRRLAELKEEEEEIAMPASWLRKFANTKVQDMRWRCPYSTIVLPPLLGTQVLSH